MQWQLLGFSMIPILVFAFVDAHSDRRKAIIAAIAAAAIECLVNSVQLGFVEIFSLVSLLLYVVMGWLSLQRDQIAVFKFQPVAIGLIWAATFWIYDGLFMSDTPLFSLIVEKHLRINEALAPYQWGYYAGYALTMSKSLPYLLVVHSGLTGYAALKLTTWKWCLIRVFGFYAMVVVLFYAERLFRVPY